MEPIQYLNRETGKVETEQVYGEGFLRWAYGNPLGKISLHTFVKRPFFSKWYGRRMDQAQTKERVRPFIEKYGLDEADFEKKDFNSFNDFFYRSLKQEARPLSDSAIVLPADGRHLGFAKAREIEGVFVKGQKFDLSALVDDAELGKRYENGSLLLSRLCPVDYHRFHFPCAGTPGKTRVINGPLFSVSPIALRKKLGYFWENKRTLTELVTETMGTVLCMEIGATCVGSIHQTYQPNHVVEKGDEKGYFAFGGSSTILLFEPDAITLDDDLLTAGSEMQELYAKVRTSAGSLNV